MFVRSVWHGHILRDAASLSYTTLLSLVPLLAVMFGLSNRMFPAWRYDESVKAFLLERFIPPDAEFLLSWLGKFQDKAAHLAWGGTVVLLLLALTLVVNVDLAINRVWRRSGQTTVSSAPGYSRHQLLVRLPLYLLVLVFGSSLVGLGFAATSYVLSLPLMRIAELNFGITHYLLRWAPYLGTSFAFTLLYIWLPAHRVRTHHALLSAVFAAVLFEVAKTGFGLYVGEVSYYQQVYGAVAVVPLFLIWVHVSWVIILCGAHLCFCLDRSYLWEARESMATPTADFAGRMT